MKGLDKHNKKHATKGNKPMETIKLILTREQAILLSQAINHTKQDFNNYKEELLTSIESQLNNIIARG